MTVVTSIYVVPCTSTSRKSLHKSCSTCHVLCSGWQQRALPLHHFTVKGDKAEMIFWAEVLQNLQQGIPSLFQGENNHFEYYCFSVRTRIGIAA